MQRQDVEAGKVTGGETELGRRSKANSAEVAGGELPEGRSALLLGLLGDIPRCPDLHNHTNDSGAASIPHGSAIFLTEASRHPN